MACACGCGKFARKGNLYNSDCQNECACGCGNRARYAYAPGHRPVTVCVRCGKVFSPLKSEGGLCSLCRKHVRDGGPLERDGKLIQSRAMQKAAPEGRRWCSGCNQYRLLKFFGKDAARYYSRCKPCHRKQTHAAGVAKRYGLTAEAYAAIQTFQGGRCAICQIATGASKALAVDHNHSCCPGNQSCGKCIRGLLCSTCNQLLGFARDNPEMFKRAILYLERPPAQNLGIGP